MVIHTRTNTTSLFFSGFLRSLSLSLSPLDSLLSLLGVRQTGNPHSVSWAGGEIPSVYWEMRKGSMGVQWKETKNKRKEETRRRRRRKWGEEVEGIPGCMTGNRKPVQRVWKQLWKKKKKKKPDNKGGQSAVSASDDRTEAENKPSASVVLTKRE